MKNLLLALLALICVQPGLSLAAEKDAGAQYQQLLAAAKAGEPVDYAALRYAYAATPSASLLNDDTRRAMFTAANSGDWAGALTFANKVIENNYTDGTAHLVAAIAYKKAGKEEDAKREATIADGLFKSIQTGDGLTPETAFTVISVSEEYALLNYMGMDVQSQALSHIGEHSYDVMTVTDESGKTFVYYFNIDIVWAAEAKMMGAMGLGGE